jgi:sugar (pentulose or hexulose) kinase
MAPAFSAPFGNALLAGAGIGLIADPGDLAERVCRVEHDYTPDARWHDQYRRLFEIYQRLYPQLKGLFVDLARL